MAVGKSIFRLEADTKGFVKGYDRARASQGKLNRGMKNTTKHGKGADAAMGKMLSKVGGFLSLATAVAAVTGAMRDLVQKGKEAAELIRGQEEGKKRLLQISDTEEQFRAREDAAKRIAKQTGISVARAEVALFKGISAGFTDKRAEEVIGKIAPFSAAPGELVSIPKQLQFALGGETLGGTAESQLNALLAGSKAATASVEQIAEGLLLPAAALKTLGATGKEGIAGLATVTNALGSVELGRTALASLADELKGRFRGQGLTGPVEQLAKLSPERRDAIITNKRAQRALEALIGNFGFYTDVLVDVGTAIENTGTGRSLIAQKGEIARTGELGQLEATRRAEARGEVAFKGRGLRQLGRDQVRAAVDIALERAGTNPIGRLSVNADLSLAEFFDASPSDFAAKARNRLLSGGLTAGGIDPAIVNDAFASLEAALRENTKAQNGNGVPRPVITQRE